MENKTDVVTFDIETAFNLGAYFGKPYDVNIGKLIQEGYVLGFCWKVLGKKKVHSCFIWDYPLYKKQPRNDIEVIKKWRDVMNSAAVIVGHNSDQFDNKVMMGRLMKHRLKPIELPQSFDTKKKIKQVAKIDSNKLDDLGTFFGIGNKVRHEGIEMWWDCMQGVKSAQKKMDKYCQQDVILTEKLYLIERTYSKSHPNMAVLTGRTESCTRCGRNQGFVKAGYRYTTTGKKQLWHCVAIVPETGERCMGKNTDRVAPPKPHKTEKPKYV